MAEREPTLIETLLDDEGTPIGGTYSRSKPQGKTGKGNHRQLVRWSMKEYARSMTRRLQELRLRLNSH